ncbi:MAG: mycothiol system anti-sigma-R factor [bacterium]
MSCGGNHGCECSDAMSLVYRYLDGEIDHAQRAEVSEHLEDCMSCRDEYGVEQVVKALLHRSCCEERAPETLRIRIVARIQEVRITYRRGG